MNTSKLTAKLACITDVLKTECIFFLPPNYLYLTQNKMSWLSKKIFVCFSWIKYFDNVKLYKQCDVILYSPQDKKKYVILSLLIV